MFHNVMKESKTQTDSEDLQITKALVMRAIEHLKAQREQVNPATVAAALGIDKSIFYADLELLDSIYRYGSNPVGPDVIIQELVAKVKSANRKIKKLEKKLTESEESATKSFSDGFSKGASISYKSGSEQNDQMITWARGVLYLEEAELNQEKIKSAYRRLTKLLHPDKSGSEATELMHSLNKAYEILLNACMGA